LQMIDFIEKRALGGFHTVPTGRGLWLNSYPGLRCACPGLLSLLPTGEYTQPVSSIGGRLRRWTTVTKLSLT
jgi:hypothetical protein